MLVNALDYQTPKVVVADVFDMWPGRKTSDAGMGQVHEALDAIPLSLHKYQTVRDLIDEKNANQRWGMLFDFGIYHVRWNDLQKDDFATQLELETNASIWKGAGSLYEIAERNEHQYTKSDSLSYDEMAKDYLVRIIKLCHAKNIELVLINTGYDCDDDAQYFADSVDDIAKQYRIPYIDFTKLNIINFDSDLQSGGHNTHVNFAGAEKFTSFIGARLMEMYSLPDHRHDKQYDSWWAAYQSFVDVKVSYLRNQNSLDLYCLCLADDMYDIIFEVMDLRIVNEDKNKNMLENLGVDIEQFNDGYNFAAIDMVNQGVFYFSNPNFTNFRWASNLGEIRLQKHRGLHEVYLNGELLSAVGVNEGSGIRFTVIDRDTGEVVDVHEF